MTATLAFAGTSGLTFSTSADLGGDAAVAGDSSLTFTTSGTLAGSAGMLGAATLTFAPSADLRGIIALIASSSITFTPTADLLDSMASGDLSGTTSLTFTIPGADLSDAAGQPGLNDWIVRNRHRGRR